VRLVEPADAVRVEEGRQLGLDGMGERLLHRDVLTTANAVKRGVTPRSDVPRWPARPRV
jgi:hypothetical protein